MRKYEIMQEFLDGSFSGCFIVNDEVVHEDSVREWVDKANDVVFNYEEDELTVNLDGNEVTISHM